MVIVSSKINDPLIFIKFSCAFVFMLGYFILLWVVFWSGWLFVLISANGVCFGVNGVYN